MTQAPATTVATAVRQHGGGRHPLNLLCTAPAGRLQDSRGGVINRRAEGATSSHPLPASCAAAAHPTTGVRRARELSPSLRSQSCQHAQLVEGYKPCPLMALAMLLKQLNGQRSHHVVVLELSDVGRLTVTNYIPAIETINHACREPGGDLQLSQHMNLTRIKFRNRDGAQGFEMRRPFQMPAVLKIGIDGVLTEIHNGIRKRAMEQAQLLLLVFGKKQQDLPEPFQLLFLSHRLMHVGKRCGPQDGKQRADGLHPSRNITGLHPLLDPVAHCANQKPNNSAAKQQTPSSPQRPCNHLRWNKSLHPTAPPSEIWSSLPAPCHHVQRGAA